MRILILHNTYQQLGGEDVVVEAESKLLVDGGHHVVVELISNDEISGFANKAQAFFNTPYNSSRKAWMVKLLKKTKPDVVHIHNFFPLLTPAVHEVASEMGVAVVQTMHNFRIFCAGALLLRNGQICEKCISGNRNWALVHRCYKNSFAGSLAVVRMQKRTFKVQTWEKHTDKIIALTQFGKDKLIEGGLPESRIVVKSNFIEDNGFAENIVRDGALFVGRISKEKGVDKLIEAWRGLPEIPLKIIGDGSERIRLEGIAPANIKFLGLLSRKNVRVEMAKASVLIMPSVWYEGFPMTIVEAFEAGTPVIASRLGSMEEIISHGKNGLHFNAGDSDDLAKTVRAVFSDIKNLVKMGKNARAEYESKYTSATNYGQLIEIYEEAIQDRKACRGPVSSI